MQFLKKNPRKENFNILKYKEKQVNLIDSISLEIHELV